MPIKFLRLSLAVMAVVLLFNTSCTKIDTTQLGADLIPAVDNIHTFADTLSIIGVQEIPPDTTRLFRTENHVLGSINNDPVFGKTKADVYLQLKPTFFPFYYGNTGDTIVKFDSVILCLAYKGFYGDSTIPQNLKVYTLSNNTTNFKDSSYRFDFTPNVPFSNLVGETTVKPADVMKKVFFRYGKDSVSNQVRIRLNQSFLNEIIALDTAANGSKNALRSDSLFKTFFKGFAVVGDNSTGNGLFYIGLADALTRLEIHYTKKNATTTDTAYSAWSFSQGAVASLTPSAHANALVRDRSASELANAPQPDALYIQSTPGTSATLSIPELSNYSNRVIHRAEIILEQIPGDPVLDKVLAPPAFLYLDLVDETTLPKKFKPIYYDLSPSSFYDPDDKNSFFPTGGVDHSYFGGFVRTMSDNLGTRAYYTFNLTRYVQNLVTKKGINYNLRLSAPYNLSYFGLNLTYSNSLAFGRVKLGNGNHPNYRTRMRIVYSNL